MGPSDGQVTGFVQEVLRHPHQNSRVSLEDSGASHPQDCGLFHRVGGTRRGKARLTEHV